MNTVALFLGLYIYTIITKQAFVIYIHIYTIYTDQEMQTSRLNSNEVQRLTERSLNQTISNYGKKTAFDLRPYMEASQLAKSV